MRNRQSIEAGANARSNRYWAGLPAAGQPSRATMSWSAGLVMPPSDTIRHQNGNLPSIGQNHSPRTFASDYRWPGQLSHGKLDRHMRGGDEPRITADRIEIRLGFGQFAVPAIEVDSLREMLDGRLRVAGQ